ncbi:MAG TPA: DUF2249 domain-containing protein [Ktedonobacterales bacterium]
MSATTTHKLTDAIRAHHRALAETLDQYVADVEASAAETDAASLAGLLDGLTGFLSGELLPHAQGEERSLYPALDPIIREHGSPTATMSVDHEYIGAYARQITETANALRAASASDRAGLTRKLERLVLQLQTLFGVHLAKEERVYLPLIEQTVSADAQSALLDALHEEAESAENVDHLPALDVRELAPARRHPLIFERFNALTVGASFILINDHDPKPLYYQLVAEYPGQLLWVYLEQGPEVWRVRVGKAS